MVVVFFFDEAGFFVLVMWLWNRPELAQTLKFLLLCFENKFYMYEYDIHYKTTFQELT